MTGDEFNTWLLAMKQLKGINKQAAGELLGRHATWVSRAQKKGADKTTALACAALLAGLQPFSVEPVDEISM